MDSAQDKHSAEHDGEAHSPIDAVMNDVDVTLNAGTSNYNTNVTKSASDEHAPPSKGASPQLINDKPMSVTQDTAPEVVTATRTRTRGARPNYAEDQEMEVEYTAPVKRSPDIQTTAKTKNFDSSSAQTTFAAANGADPSSSTTGRKRKSTANPPLTADAISTTSTRIKSQPALSTQRPYATILTFDRSHSKVKAGKLVADDGTTIAVDDFIYLVCEPPGDPYYLCRVMELLHTDSSDTSSPVDTIRVNWFYRPRDVQRFNADTRLVYGTMHSDTCPLTSIRGKCQIKHRSEIDDFEEYRKGKDCFWYSQIFDRFIRRFYEVIPCSQIVNVPEKVKRALDERWKYVAVESVRVKELTGAIKTCKRCVGFCASHDSVACALCHNSYHMACVNPPLLQKPTRGFGWSCGPCSRAQQKKLDARNTPQHDSNDADEDMLDEDNPLSASTRAPSPDEEQIDLHPGTQAEVAMARMWPMRYLGIHCRVEDALQYDDRAIYPRASSRLGPRHQTAVNVWHGRPVELIKPAEIKKKYIKTTSHKKDARLSKETVDAINKDREDRARRPKWVLDQPVGYVARGEDYPNDDPRNTARLLFKIPEDKPSVDEGFVDSYVKRAKGLAKQLRVLESGVNFIDKALELFVGSEYDDQAALSKLAKVDRGKDLKEPVFTRDDLSKFEDGVRKYGSEHRLIKEHMHTKLPISTIIRFYYLWKKTPQGKEIWNNYGGRKGTKKLINLDSAAIIHAEVANAADDSAFDGAKAISHKRTFQCKFCSTKHSQQWRRAPGAALGQTVQDSDRLLALCLRCAGLWRKYAIKWDEDENRKALMGAKGYKRRIDEELLRELQAVSEVSPAETAEALEDGPRKKSKIVEPKEPKKPPVRARTPTPPPIIPVQPKRRRLPCAVCKVLDCGGRFPISCISCNMAVHKHCYGVKRSKSEKWTCDQCTNDRSPTVSTDNVCVLCPIEYTVIDLWDHPKVSHKKKTDRDREKERPEKVLMDAAKAEYVSHQVSLGRPTMPREPLKRTDGNNWVHVTCALWTPEIKFSDSDILERAEGFRAIPLARYEAKCKLCKSQDHGACVACHQCHANFHVACAREAGYTFGFDVTPVKGSRKDQITTVSIPPESGYLTAAIWCRDHAIKTIVHPMQEIVDDNSTTVLETFALNYKQADRSLTGSARKANLLSTSIKTPAHVSTANPASRRVSIVNAGKKGRSLTAGDKSAEGSPGVESVHGTLDTLVNGSLHKTCVHCGTDASPRFWSINNQAPDSEPIKAEGDTNAHGAARAILECHKCHLKARMPVEASSFAAAPLSQPAWPPVRGTIPLIEELHFFNVPEEVEADIKVETSNGVKTVDTLPKSKVSGARKSSVGTHRDGTTAPAISSHTTTAMPVHAHAVSKPNGGVAGTPAPGLFDRPSTATSLNSYHHGPVANGHGRELAGSPGMRVSILNTVDGVNNANGTPGPGGRSMTPQDVAIDPRLSGGASASPNLRNLLS